MKNLTKLSLALAAVLAAGSAHAEQLNVGATVAQACTLNLEQVSSGTVSTAEEDDQTVANLSLRCNTPGGATVTIAPTNGDLKSADGILINYTMLLDVDGVDALDIARTDTSPGSTHSSSLGFFSPVLANEVDAVFKMDINVEAPGPFVEGQVLFPARNAPAGDYSESFDFSITGL